MRTISVLTVSPEVVARDVNPGQARANALHVLGVVPPPTRMMPRSDWSIGVLIARREQIWESHGTHGLQSRLAALLITARRRRRRACPHLGWQLGAAPRIAPRLR